MKKLFFLFLVYLSIWVSFASTPPVIKCDWLPGCQWNNTDLDTVTARISDFIWKVLIQYVAVFAVIALMISWIMYLLSSWDEEKVKKAKSWIIWSLVWVFLSVSAWFIIGFINNISISN